MYANGQKLPNKQIACVWAPDNIKIDGNAGEWKNEFQAYNHATDIFYTIANDDQNIYLTVQAIDPDIINKIIGGGITFGIQKLIKRNNGNKISITYPVIEYKNIPFFNLRDRPTTANSPNILTENVDSIVIRNNKILEQRCKWIGVIGIKGLDTLISVYNQDGIRAVGLFNSKKTYTLELSISLKQIGKALNEQNSFAYNITLNGANTLGKATVLKNSSMGGDAESMARMEMFVAQANTLGQKLSAPTNFSGDYTLAKKP